MSDTYIRTAGLWKSYPMGKELVNALAGVDLEVPRGSFMAILGPSGSGKSTLLHLIGGLDRPTEGNIHVNGKRLEDMDEIALAKFRRKQVGFVFQSFNLIPSMTAVDNVAFPLRFDGVSRRERERKALEIIELVGLGDRSYHRPTELSGGQQQRTAIARALINHPDLILADEPTGNLDTRSSMEILQLLARLNDEGHTVVIVSHDPRVTNLSTDITCLLDGRVVDMQTYNAALALMSTEGEPQ